MHNIVFIIVNLIVIGVHSRNIYIFIARGKLLDKISDINRFEISAGIFDMWLNRYDYLDSVSYTSMILKFWKPIEKFYDMEMFNFPSKLEK